MQVQIMEDDKVGLLLFHAENIDGVIELDNSKLLLLARHSAWKARQHALGWALLEGCIHMLSALYAC